MILGKDINPQKNIYYLGAVVIEVLRLSDSEQHDFFDLHQQVNRKIKISLNLFTLTLDWLFLLGLIKNSNGSIYRCF